MKLLKLFLRSSLPFDVRCLGLYYWIGFERRGFRFDHMYEGLTRHKPREAERDADGRWKIVWELPGAVAERRTVWLDEPRGFTVVRSETRYEDRSAQKTGGPLVWQEPTQASDVTWEVNNGVWVPKTFKIQTRRRGALLSCDLSFEWESVNQPVPDNLFTVDGLNIKDRRLVIDYRTGQRIIARVLNDSPGHRTYFHTKEPSPRLLWIILANAAVALALLLGFGYYFRRRSAKKSSS